MLIKDLDSPLMMDEAYKQETIRSYDEYAPHYGRKFRSHFTRVLPQADRFLSHLDRGAKVIDLGSGPGAHAEYFLFKKMEVLCFDLSVEMVNKCRAKGLEAMVGDIERLDELGWEHEFDGVWAYASLLHLPKEKFPKALYDISRIVKKDGVVGISVKEDRPGVSDGFVEKVETKGTQRFFVHYRIDEMMEYLKEQYTVVWADRFPVNDRTCFLDFLLRPRSE